MRRRDAKPKCDLRKYSRETVAQVERFRLLYPNKKLLALHFSPANWGVCTQNAAQWAAEPTISLKWIDKAYQTQRLAESIILTHYVQLYRTSCNREDLDMSVAEQQAAIFVGKYGSVPINCVCAYFAEYPLWKKSLSQFDFGDILRQFPVFLNDYRHRHYTPKAAESEIRPDWPIIAYKRYIIREILAGVNIDSKESVMGVYDGQGVITMEELMEIKSMSHDGLRTLLTELEAACPSNF